MAHQIADLRASFATGAKVNGADQTFVNIVMGHTPDVPAVYQKATMYGLAAVAQAALAWLKSDRCGSGVGAVWMARTRWLLTQNLKVIVEPERFILLGNFYGRGDRI